MKDILLVDGYNIIGAWAKAEQKDWPVDECRDRLANMLEEYAALNNIYVVLVFDGYKSDKIATHIEKKKHIEIVFTKKDETADHYIEKTVYNAPKFIKTYVATSDGLQQASILGDGAFRISSREMLRLLYGMDKRKSKQFSSESKKNSIADRLPNDLLQKLEQYRRTNTKEL